MVIRCLIVVICVVRLFLLFDCLESVLVVLVWGWVFGG